MIQPADMGLVIKLNSEDLTVSKWPTVLRWKD
jgi:hypothetical protein